MKRARFRKRNLTAQTSNSVLAQPGENLSLVYKNMEIKDLTHMEIEGLRAVFPDIIKQSAPLVQTPLKKLFRIIEDAEEERVKQPKSEVKIRVGDRVEELISRKSGRVLSTEGGFCSSGCSIRQGETLLAYRLGGACRANGADGGGEEA